MAVAVCYHRVEELENHGVNRNDIAKLKTAGFNTIEAVRKFKSIVSLHSRLISDCTIVHNRSLMQLFENFSKLKESANKRLRRSRR